MSAFEAFGLVCCSEKNTLRFVSALTCSSFATLAALLVVNQIEFSPDWGRECDYNLKIWVTVWNSAQTLIYLFNTVEYACKLRRPPEVEESSTESFLGLFARLLTLFCSAFWLYGIKPVLVDGDSDCNASTLKWGLGFWYTVVAIMGAYTIAFCFLCWYTVCTSSYSVNMHDNDLETGAANEPTPTEIINLLEPQTWAEIKEAKQTVPAELPSNEQGHEPNTRCVSATDLPKSQSAMVSNGTSILRLSSQNRTTSRPIRPSPSHTARISTGHSTTPSALSVARADRLAGLVAATIGLPNSSSPGHKDEDLCSICTDKFDKTDQCIVLPCDTRHVFHSECVLPWLAKSQMCPCCRANVVDLLVSKATP